VIPGAEQENEDQSGELRGVTEREVVDIEELSLPRQPVIYEVVRRAGEEEMARPALSLWWSGVAAGLSMSFSLLTQAAIYIRLPDSNWRPLIVGLGYTVGFLMVILSRQQLFTENTVTVVLPVMKKFSLTRLGRIGRIWSIVFVANMVGTFLAAAFYALTPLLTPELQDGMLALSRHSLEAGWSEMFCRAVASGFLISAMVWMVPSAEAAKFHVVMLMTYLISIGSFIHVVAGSVEAFFLLISGELSFGAVLGSFLIPVLLGNIVGGTVLFALISHAQVMHEI
jgi:formate/nitrite transporter FocA (FNT family)